MNINAAKITNKGHVAFLAMRENEKTGEEVPAHYRIAEALESSNLIAPDLPQPTNTLEDGLGLPANRGHVVELPSG